MMRPHVNGGCGRRLRDRFGLQSQRAMFADSILVPSRIGWMRRRIQMSGPFRRWYFGTFHEREPTVAEVPQGDAGPEMGVERRCQYGSRTFRRRTY
jgi:hypothetical protein